MSYILSRGTKGRPPPPTRRPTQRPMIRGLMPPSRSATGGQIQIQKPKAQEQINDQIMNQRVKDTMSMDKVLQDLRILEEQQLESERKLKAAQELKQRRIDALAHAELRLDDLKYKNGTLQACIDRHRETLAVNQRRLAYFKERGRKRSEDIEVFSKEVDMLLDAIQGNIVACRDHQYFVNIYAKKTGVLRDMVEESLQEEKELRQTLQDIQNRQEELHETIRQESQYEQQLTKEVSDLRQKILEAQENLTSAVNERNARVNQLEMVETEIANEEAHHQANKISLEADIRGLEDILKDLKIKSNEMADTADQLKKECHSRWSQIVELQKAEGHEPSLLPSETNEPPVLDLKMINSSLEKEKSALEEEKFAENQLRDDVASLGDRLQKCRINYEEKTKALENEKASLVEALAKEEARKKSKFKMIEELRNTERDLAGIIAVTAPLKEIVDEERLAREKELVDIRAEADEARTMLEEVLAERAKIEEQGKAKDEANQNEVAELQAAIAEEHEQQKGLDITMQDLEKLCNHKFSSEEVAKRKKDAETASREIERCIEKYPHLEDLPIEYRKDLSSSEQIDIDLAELKATVSAREAELRELQEAKKKGRSTKEPSRPRLSYKASKSATSKHSPEHPSESVAKPRSLLRTFVEASQDDEESEDDDHIPFDDTSKSTIQSEKRVRWEENTVGPDDDTEKAHNLNSQQSQPKPVHDRRNSFASGKPRSTGRDKAGKSNSSGNCVDNGIRDKDEKSDKNEGIHGSRSSCGHSPNSAAAADRSAQYQSSSEQRKSGNPKERIHSKTQKASEGKRSVAGSSSDPRQGTDKRAAPTSSRHTSSKSEHARKKSILQPSRSNVSKHGSSRKDAPRTKEAKLDQSLLEGSRSSNTVAKKALKRPRGNDDVSAGTKTTQRPSKKPAATERDNTLSQSTKDSQKRRRRPKSKSSSLFKDGIPDISFA